MIFFKMNLSESTFLASLAGFLGIGSNFLDGNYDGSYTMDTKEKNRYNHLYDFQHTETVTYGYAFEGSSISTYCKRLRIRDSRHSKKRKIHSNAL